MKNSFILYTEINEVLQELTNEEKGILFQAIVDYQMTGEVPELERHLKLLFLTVKIDLDKNNQKYAETVEKRREAGKRGGEANANKEKQNEANEANASKSKQNKQMLANASEIISVKQKVANQADNDNDNDNVLLSNDNNMLSHQIVTAYNDICVSLPKVTKLTPERKKKIQARLKAFTQDEIEACFVILERSDFASGRKGGWKASFDWVFENDKNILKVLEGNYDNTQSQRSASKEERLRRAYEDIQREVGAL